jgi:ABC-2 type transport system permease protein
MTAMLGTGARIAGERQVGWNRQLRISPLSAPAYLRAKVAISYLMAALSLILLSASGTILGVRLPASEWLWSVVLIALAARAYREDTGRA